MNRYWTKGKDLDKGAMALSREKWDAIAKPLRGLGRLEDMVVKMAGIQGKADVSAKKRAILVFCSDNGVTAQGVTQTDSHVTAVVADNIAEGRASVNRMCSRCGADVFAVDMGILGETYSPAMISRKIGKGTADFTAAPAMEEEQVHRAIETGIDLVKECKEKGYTLLGTGEMGIGNTTTGSAIAAALLHLSADAVTGRGAGLSDEGFARKRKVIEGALVKYDLYHREALDVMRFVGGFDIAGMAGAFIGGSMYGVPVIIDGMISAVAALVACRLCPKAVNGMLASHLSREPSMQAVMEELALEPVIYGDLALGEGTGASLLFPMLDMALSVYDGGETFEKNQIESYQKFGED